MVVAYRPAPTAVESILALASEEHDLAVVVVANQPVADLASVPVPAGSAVLASPRNRGFAEGVNVGVAHALAAGAGVVVIANDDVRLTTDAVCCLAEEATPARAVAPTITADDPRDDFAGGRIDWRHGFGYHESGGRDFLTAAALAIHERTWALVGPFDASLFLYYEDVDWSQRARARGIELAVAELTIHHAGGTSSGGTAGPTWAYYHTRNRIRLLARYRGRAAAARAWGWTLAWTLGYLRDGRRVLIPAQLRALRDAALGRAGRGPYPRR